MVNVIGQNLYMTKKYLKEQIRPEDSVKIISLLPDSSRKVLEGIIDVHKWYDLAVYKDLMDSILRVLGREGLKRLGEYTLENQMKFFGFFLRFMNLKKVIEKGPEMWKKIYSAGKVEITQVDEKQVIVVIKEFPFTDALALGSMYWSKAIFEKVSQSRVTGQFNRKSRNETVFSYLVISS